MVEIDNFFPSTFFSVNTVKRTLEDKWFDSMLQVSFLDKVT